MTIISQHTQGKVITLQFRDQGGVAKPLTGVTSIKGAMRSGKQPNEIDTTIVGTVAVTDAPNGLAEWTLDITDTDNAGYFGLYFYAYSAGGVVEAFLRDELHIAPAPTPPS